MLLEEKNYRGIKNNQPEFGSVNGVYNIVQLSYRSPIQTGWKHDARNFSRSIDCEIPRVNISIGYVLGLILMCQRGLFIVARLSFPWGD